MSEENVQLIRRLYDAVAERDSETVLSIYHADVEWDFSDHRELAALVGETVYHGHEGLRRWARAFYEAWEYVDAELEEVIDSGEDRVVAVLNYRGRGRISGIEVGFTRMAGVFTIRDRRVVRAEWYRDKSPAVEAAGLSD
jgi:ketosteroid isomerase-like protein